MDTWIIVAGAVGFTLLVMLLGPWMWSSTWTQWRLYRGEDSSPGASDDASRGKSAPRP